MSPQKRINEKLKETQDLIKKSDEILHEMDLKKAGAFKAEKDD